MPEKYIYTIYDAKTNEVLFSGVKSDCYAFINQKKLKPEKYSIKSGLPNKGLRTTSPQNSKPKGFFKRVFKK